MTKIPGYDKLMYDVAMTKRMERELESCEVPDAVSEHVAKNGVTFRDINKLVMEFYSWKDKGAECFIKKVHFPSLNKQSKLSDYDEQIDYSVRNQDHLRKGFYETVHVHKIIDVPEQWYLILKDHLMHDSGSLYATADGKQQIGGSGTLDEELNGLPWETLVSDPKLLERFRKDSYINVVEVRCLSKVPDHDTGEMRVSESFYVNTEGHQYARYVGRDERYVKTVDKKHWYAPGDEGVWETSEKEVV